MNSKLTNSNFNTQLSLLFADKRAAFYDSGISDSIHAREQSLKSALNFGLPTFKHEDYKYTSFKFLEQANLQLQAHEKSESIIKDQLPTNLGETQIIFINGFYNENLSTIVQQPQIRIVPFSKASSNLAECTANLYNKQFSTLLPFAALNHALHSDGIYIEVLAQSEITTPIHIVYLHSNSDDKLKIINPRTHIHCQPNSKCQIIEQHLSLKNTNAYFSNASTVLTLENGTTCNYTFLQQHAVNNFTTINTNAMLNKDAELNMFTLTQGAQTSHHCIDVLLQGERSNATLNGLYQLNFYQHADHVLKLVHSTGNTQSKEFYRGILADNSRGIFNGKITVTKGSDQTDADMVNNNLLLSELAEADTRPQLEIYAEDVKCSHGATVGKLDEEALYYLQSRGINIITAKKLLTIAFAQSIIDRISNTKLKQHIEHSVNHKLKSMLATQGEE